MSGKNILWLERPIAALCAACILLAGSVVLALNAAQSKGAGSDLSSFSISIKHYGVNAKEIERSIAMPLEDAVFMIDDVQSVLTTSENGNARAYITFKNNSGSMFTGKKTEGRYEAVSSAAQRVYEQLPSSAQRPEITTQTESRRPAWTAAVYAARENVLLNNIIERTVKPALASVAGAAEVEVSGSGINEIVIGLKPEAAVERGVSCEMLASILSSNDALLPAGYLEENDRETMVMVDGRYDSVSSLKGAIIPLAGGGSARLGDLADVVQREREPDIISRLDGNKTIIISVFPSDGANLGMLSAALEKQINQFDNYPIEFNVLSDRGKEEQSAYRSVLLAALQGTLSVACITAFLSAGKKSTRAMLDGRERKNKWTPLVCSFVVPYICAISACILMMCGFSLDKTLLAGLAAGIGAAVDTCIICCEQLSSAISIHDAKIKLKQIRAPLISGALTTIIALIPLAATPFASRDIIVIAWAIGVVNFVSLVLALTVLPPLFCWKQEIKMQKNNNKELAMCGQGLIKNLIKKSKLLLNHIVCFVNRSFTFVLNISMRHPKIVCAIAILITASGVLSIITAGTDTGQTESESSVYAQIEFEGGLRSETVDKALEAWTEKIKLIGGITSVESGARVGSATVMVNFDPAVIANSVVRNLLREEKIPGAFVYMPENSGNDRIWSITVSGDSNEKCHAIAEEAAKKCSAMPAVQETVLNFKDGSKNILFKPDRERIARGTAAGGGGFIFTTIANALRWGIHGPVAYKRIGRGSDDAGETDVRIRGLGLETPHKSELSDLSVNTSAAQQNAEKTIININAMFTSEEGREPSGIRRLGRRRIASISIRTKAADAREIKKMVMPQLQNIELPPGYSIEFDREAIEAAEALSKSIFYYFLAILFCYMIIAAANESFSLPLLVLSVVPVSMAAPAIWLLAANFKFNSATACAFLSVCGIAVNSSVLIVDSIFARDSASTGASADIHDFYSDAYFLYKSLRRRFSTLVATAGTTIIAALPFIFLHEGANTIIKILSLVTALGVLVSCICSLFLVPSILILFWRNFFGKKFRVAEQRSSFGGHNANFKKNTQRWIS